MAKIGLRELNADYANLLRALKLADASKVAPVDKFSVVLVAILAFVMLGERLSAWQWSAIGLITVGTIILAVKR